MKTITERAVSVLLLAALIIAGMLVFLVRYVGHGRDWAYAYARSDVAVSGTLLDRNGVLLAFFNANTSEYASSRETRMANYHVTGDYWGRTGTGVLFSFAHGMQGYSLLTGTTRSRSGDLKLTVDSELNRIVYEAIGDRNGAAMLVNYRTGELLTMVSTPVVDPQETDPFPPDGAYINRCLAASFTPGSVFKLVTAAAAIETLPRLSERSFTCTGSDTIAGVPITCSGVHGTQSFEEALANSCNVAFAQIAVSVGHRSLLRCVKDYGFLSGHHLDDIATASGSFPTDFVGDPELGWAGVGQSTDLVCPYTMLRFVAAVANRGVLTEPTLLLDGKEPERSVLVTRATADRLGAMMRNNVVSHYGGDDAFPGLRLCAKTGTGERGDGTSNAWFVGFLEDDAHPYAFVVLLERGGGGLAAAAPVARTMLQAAVRKY